MEHDPKPAWVAGRLALIRPAWTPNPGRARARLAARRAAQQPPRRGLAMAAALAATLFAAAVLPQARAVGQELWQRLFFRGFDAVRIDLSRVPLPLSITTNGNLRTVAGAAEAGAAAGFAPRLPAAELLPETPVLTVTGPISARQVVDVPALVQGLAAVGAGDFRVPPEWQGQTLRLELGALVIAAYGEEVSIVQARPAELHVPAGFPLAALAEAAFRCAGLPGWQAREMGERFAARPAWLLDIPAGEVVFVDEVRLPAGPALVLTEPDDGGAYRVTVLFESRDRVYAVSSPSRAESLRLAEAIP